jgi:hypothetical protein
LQGQQPVLVGFAHLTQFLKVVFLELLKFDFFEGKVVES